jgi:hypothetical protein
MKNIKEIYQALLAGKTLKHISGCKMNLETSANHNFSNPEDWKIYEYQWEMKPAKWLVDYEGDIEYTPIDIIAIAQKFGMKFHSENQAEKARDQMKQTNLLRYWVSTMQDLDEGTFYIYVKDNKYYEAIDDNRGVMGKIYMTEKTAIKICEALNNGELELK